MQEAPEDRVHWHRTAPPAPPCRSLQGEIDVDVAIIGAGLTGLRAAIGLAEAGSSVAVLDAREVGFGASGRSGGQCNPIWRATPEVLSKKLGPAQAERLIEATLSAADELFADIRRHEISCEAEQNGWIQAAHTARAARDLEALGRAWRGVGAEIGEIGGEALQRLSGSPEYAFGLCHAKGGSVQPLALTRGFASAAQRLGAQIFERSPAQSLERQEGKWQVRTASGLIRAERVLLTTNAYTDKLFPGLRETVLPMVSISLATAPLSAAQRKTVLPGRHTISDTRLAIYYSRYDAAHRLIFGCIGSSDEMARAWGGLKRLQKGLRVVFPQLRDIAIECTWGGRIAMTQDMMPRLYEPAPGILAGLGYSGRGIAMTSVMGRSLARKLLGSENIAQPFPVSALDPQPLNGLARRVVPLAAPMLALRDRVSVSLDRLRGPVKRDHHGSTKN